MSRIDREPTRSKLSNNWRIKSDATPRDRSDNAVRQQMNSYPSHRHTQQNSPIHENGISMNTEAGSLGIQTIRGEDDPRTAQAIAEGRRLYVGNLPYMAKADDVEDLFKSGEYRVWDLCAQSGENSTDRPKGYTSTCLPIPTPDAILHIVLLS